MEKEIISTDGSLTVSNAAIVEATLNGRAAVLSSSATAERVVETGSTTNTGIVAFTTPFTGSPVVLTGYATSAATSTVAFATLVNPTNFTANGVGGASITWIAVGTK